MLALIASKTFGTGEIVFWILFCGIFLTGLIVGEKFTSWFFGDNR